MTDRSRQVVATGRYSPLRYPGGKGKLARFVAEVIRLNSLADGHYVEPYAGGAAVAWELLLTGVVRRVSINDVSRPVYAFWCSVLHRTDELLRLIVDTPVNLENRDRLKRQFMAQSEVDDLELAFATFFLNRTNRSGILNGGMIGGRAQTGAWKLDARYNKDDLVARIERIARAKSRIEVSNEDAVTFVRSRAESWSRKTLIYLDPPYYDKGPDLYPNHYKPGDHDWVAVAVKELKVPWIVSYDDVAPIHALYEGTSWLQYTIGYSARSRTNGREAMFASPGLSLPAVSGSMVELDRWHGGDHGPYRAPVAQAS